MCQSVPVRPGRTGREGWRLFSLAHRECVHAATHGSLDWVDVGTVSWHVHTYSLQQARTATPECKGIRLHWKQTQTRSLGCGPATCTALGCKDSVWFGHCWQTGNMTGDWWKKPFLPVLCLQAQLQFGPQRNTGDSRKLMVVDMCDLLLFFLFIFWGKSLFPFRFGASQR